MPGRQATEVIARARFAAPQGQFEGRAQQLGGLVESGLVESGFARSAVAFHRLPICSRRARRKCEHTPFASTRQSSMPAASWNCLGVIGSVIPQRNAGGTHMPMGTDL